MNPHLAGWAEWLYEVFAAAAWPPAADTWLFPCDPPPRAEPEADKEDPT